jgi:tetratricopeptide (TPR) repeat protein
VRGALGSALLAVCAACTSSGTPSYEATDGPYDHLPAAEVEQVRAARERLRAGELDAARDLLGPLVARRAENVPLAVFLQEVELAGADASGRERLVARARERSEAFPTPVTLLLAARLEADADEARALIGRALSIDAECAWAHYALAHLEARAGDWVEAQARLERALEIDPGHLSGRRLEAGFLARDGKRDDARRALEKWLEVTDDDPLVDPTARFLAALDLAQLYLLAGDQGRARALLLSLAEEPAGHDARRLCILAAVEQARGQPQSALRAAVRAAGADPDDPLPVLQQAVLQESWLDDPVAARAAWEQVLEIARSEADLGALLLTMRARVELERTEALAADDVQP